MKSKYSVNTPKKRFRRLSRDAQLELIKEYPWKIKYLKCSELDLQYAAVTREPWIVHEISSLYPEVQLKVLKENWRIEYLHEKFNNSDFLSSHDFLLLKLRFGELK